MYVDFAANTDLFYQEKYRKNIEKDSVYAENAIIAVCPSSFQEKASSRRFQFDRNSI